MQLVMRLIVVTIVLALAGGAANAAGCWGISAPFGDEKSLQSDYEAPLLAQRGVGCICMDMHGRRFNWPNWTNVEAEWHNRRAATYWGIPTTLPECERVLGFEAGTLEIDDRAVLEDGSRAYFGPEQRLGNIFLPQLSYHVERIAKAMVKRFKTASGYMVTANVDLRDGSYDEQALASWQAFLKRFFGDTAPGTDSNGDICTFNGSYGGARKSWSDIPQFTSAELAADRRKRSLVDMWLADSYAGFVDGICDGLLVMDRKALAGPGVSTVAKGGADASILASRKHINVLFTDSHENARILDCAAAAFDKKVIGSGIKLVPGDYAASRQRALKLLPYLDGVCFDYAGLVRERLSGDPAKIKSFDPAFLVIPELAPFAGRFGKKERAPVLWIASDPAKIASIVVDSYCVTEAALALDPECLDLTKFKVVIYQSAAPCASLALLEELFKYALKGGVVLIDAHNVCAGPTLHGRDNKLFWWEGDFGGKVDAAPGDAPPPPKVRKLGQSGKWVYVYSPGFCADLSQTKALVRDYAGIDLPDPSQPLVYDGDGCALAIGGGEPRKVSIGCKYETAAVFDPVDSKAYLVASSNGRITLPGTVEAEKARVWVVKPYGKAVVLYTDGTIDHAASIDDGKYADSVLEFKFAEKAVISSPVAPKSLTIDGKSAPFEYDAETRTVTITRAGSTVLARLGYSK